MRRLFVVLVLLAVMVVLRRLQVETLGGADPLTLAAIGFVVLAAFALAELGAKVGLPKVTGYILAGVILGPSLGDILSSHVVKDMQMFRTLTLGLIATTAGLELDLKNLVRLAKTLSWTVLAKLVFCVIIVGGALFALESGTHLLGIQDNNALLGLCAVFAALALGTSPAIALAIIEDSKAKGRLSDLVLGAAVVKDVVVVIAMAVAIAVAQGLTSGESLDVSSLLYVGKEVVASTAAGAVLGGLLILYIRYIHAEMLLFVAAMVLVVAEISHALHLELLLVFIVAGLVVRNFSKFEHELLDPLQKISLPVFIVFFTNAGASVDLNATLELLPVALVLCLARAGAFWGASMLGGKLGRESTKIRQLAWLGYLPQAGVALGILGLASAKLPGLSASIESLGMAVVSVNLLAGPVTFRIALRRAGELPEEALGDDAEDQAAQEAIPQHSPIPALSSPRLIASLTTAEGELRRIVDRSLHVLSREHITPWLRKITPPALDDAESSGPDFVLDTVRASFNNDPPVEGGRVLGLLRELTAVLDNVDEAISVPLEPELSRIHAGDSFALRFQKRFATFSAWIRGKLRKRVRVVPARRILKTLIEPKLAQAAIQVQCRIQRMEIQALEILRRDVIETSSREDTITGLGDLAQLTSADAHHLLESAIESGLEVATSHYRMAGTPGYDTSALRYSSVEKLISSRCESLREDEQSWQNLRAAASRLLFLTVEIQRVRDRVHEILDSQVTRVVAEAHGQFRQEIDAMLGRLEKLQQHLQLDEGETPASTNQSEVAGSETKSAEREAVSDDELRERIKMEVGALLPKNSLRRVRAATAKVRNATSNRTAATVIEAFVRGGDESVEIVPELAALSDRSNPTEVRTLRLDVREIKQMRLSTTLVPAIERALAEVWERFKTLRQETLESANLANYMAATEEEGAAQDDWRERLLSGLEQAKKRLVSATEEFDPVPDRLNEALNEALEALGDGLLRAIEDAARSGEVSVAAGVRARARMIRLRESVAQVLRKLGHQANELGSRARKLVERSSSPTLNPAIPQPGDAAAIRRFLEPHQLGLVDEALPPLYPTLFRSTAIRDSRLFAAHGHALDIVIGAERAWRQDPTRGNAVIVRGSSGNGKTSLLTVAELKLATRRALTLRERRDPDERFLDILRLELGCADNDDAIVHALSRQGGLIVLDDLHHWMRPTQQGYADVERLFRIIDRSQKHCFWLVACLEESFALFDITFQISSAFPYTVRLPKCEVKDVEAAILSRQSLAGLAVNFPQSRTLAVLNRVRRRTAQQQYFRALARMSGGSLRRSIGIWLAHAKMSEDGATTLVPLSEPPALSRWLETLTILELAVLSLLLRHGALATEVLAEQLLETPQKIQRYLSTLESYELIHRVETQESKSERSYYEVRPKLLDPIAFALSELHLWSQR